MAKGHIGKRLVIEGLSKTYKNGRRVVPVFAGFDLDVSAGEFLVLLGASGCGKSSLLRIIAGLEEPDTGTEDALELDGRKISGPGPERGLIFQSYSSFNWLTATQNVKFGLRYCEIPPSEHERIALEHLDLVGLRGYADVYPRDMSGGQQQRVAIARTLATRPQLLLMDEPFAALDAQNRELLQARLLEIWRETRPTVLFVTHDIAEAAFLGQRVLVLGDSPARIVEEVWTDAEIERRVQDRGDAAMGERYRGDWIRTEPEFYQLVAKLKRALPSARPE